MLLTGTQDYLQILLISLDKNMSQKIHLEENDCRILKKLSESNSAEGVYSLELQNVLEPPEARNPIAISERVTALEAKGYVEMAGGEEIRGGIYRDFYTRIKPAGIAALKQYCNL